MKRLENTELLGKHLKNYNNDNDQSVQPQNRYFICYISTLKYYVERPMPHLRKKVTFLVLHILIDALN